MCLQYVCHFSSGQHSLAFTRIQSYSAGRRCGAVFPGLAWPETFRDIHSISGAFTALSLLWAHIGHQVFWSRPPPISPFFQMLIFRKTLPIAPGKLKSPECE